MLPPRALLFPHESLHWSHLTTLWNELIELTLRLAGQRKPVVALPNGVLKWSINALAKLRLPTPVPPEVLDYATYYFFMDSSKAIRELDYHPRPATEVLAPVIQWLRETGQV